MSHLSYRTLIQELLVNSGVLGISQQHITVAMRNTCDAEMIREELLRLHKLGHIQRFTIPAKRQGGHPQTIWRGTTSLSSYLIGGTALVDEYSLRDGTLVPGRVLQNNGETKPMDDRLLDEERKLL
jgi:hypothetical protein